MTYNRQNSIPSRRRSKPPKAPKAPKGARPASALGAAIGGGESASGAPDLNYFERKRIILMYEKKNYTRLYFIKGSGNDGWYKAFGNSALIFVTEIAPKIGSKAKIHPDLDMTVNSKIGYVSMKDMEGLAKKLEEIGIKLKENSEERWAFELGYRIDPERMVAMREQNMSAVERANKLLMPKVIMSTLYGLLGELYDMIFWMVRSMEAPTREMLGYKMQNSVDKLFRRYIRTARLDGDAGKFLAFAISEIEEMNAYCTELELLRIIDAEKMLNLAVKVHQVKEQIIYEMRVEGARRAVRIEGRVA